MTKNKTEKKEDWEGKLAPKITADSEEEYQRANNLFLPLLENYYEKLKPVIRQLLEKARQAGFKEGIKEAETLEDKFLLLKKDVGDELFSQLSYGQKTFIVNVSNTINLGDSVNIDVIYSDIERGF